MKKQTMLFGGMLFVLFLFLNGIGHAATINAATCSLADVQSAVNSAVTGDTVKVPAGSSTWTTYVTIPNDKKITLQGAGKSSTVITMSSAGTAINLGKSGSRITGIGFINAGIFSDGYDFRVDHCSMFFDSWANGISVYSTANPAVIPTGVIDNNTFINMRVLVSGSNFLLSENGVQNGLWATQLNLGSSEAVYIEDNIYTKGTGGINAVDGNYGGRFVFRYNTVDGLNLEAHSVQNYPTSNRAIRKWEIYGNIVNNTYAFTFTPYTIRGGTGIIFSNSSIGNWTYNNIMMDNVRDSATYTADNNTDGGGKCDGDHIFDGNQDATGWPCRDQIGTSYDSVQWVYSPVGSWSQTLTPAYIWNNKKENNANIPVFIREYSQNHIIPNRDYYDYNASFNGTSGVGCGTLAARPASCTTGVAYWATNQSCTDLTGMVGANPTTPIAGTLYKCTAPNTWTAYYTPYTYPHPLQGISNNISSKGATVINTVGGLNAIDMVGGLNVINQ